MSIGLGTCVRFIDSGAWVVIPFVHFCIGTIARSIALGGELDSMCFGSWITVWSLLGLLASRVAVLSLSWASMQSTLKSNCIVGVLSALPVL